MSIPGVAARRAHRLKPGIDELIRYGNALPDAAHSGVWVDIAVFENGKAFGFQAARTVLCRDYAINPDKDYVRFCDPQKKRAASGEDVMYYEATAKWRTASGGWSDPRPAVLTVVERVPGSTHGLVIGGGVGEQAAVTTGSSPVVLKQWVGRPKLGRP